MGEVLKCGRGFYTQGEFSWRENNFVHRNGGREKSLCTMQL